MLDEPLGSLDRRLREALVVDLRDLLQHTRQTALYVTHDLEEAFVLAERIVVMNAGRVEQIGPPAAIFAAPATPFVARFLGLPNLLPAEVIAVPDGREVRSALGTLPLAQAAPLGPATLLLRPERVRPGDGGPVVLTGPLQASEFRGGVRRVTIAAPSGSLQFEVPSDWPLPPLGETLTLSVDPAAALQILPPEIAPSQAAEISL
jgi:ABC-type Fe3+/spermidine/putrescine transport system ATPase subunit